VNPNNRPTVELRLVINHRKHDGSAVVRISTLMRDGSFAVTFAQEWPSGRPTPTQVELLGAKLEEELTTVVLTGIGIQGTLGVRGV